MFDAKSLLDTILGGQTAQQATAAAQSAGSAVAGVVSQAEESLKGTRVGEVRRSDLRVRAIEAMAVEHIKRLKV